MLLIQDSKWAQFQAPTRVPTHAVQDRLRHGSGSQINPFPPLCCFWSDCLVSAREIKLEHRPLLLIQQWQIQIHTTAKLDMLRGFKVRDLTHKQS